jgi:hypothetical protein
VGGHTEGVSNRREIWRDFMGRFEPSAEPRDAVERGFYVPRPGRSLAEQLAARFEINPEASHLLVGGVGSGKTTQLLVAQDRLAAHEDTDVVYSDLSGVNDLLDGALMQAGLALGHRLIQPDSTKHPFLTLIEDLGGQHKLAAAFFLQLLNLRESRPHQIVLFDALDRISDLAMFAEFVAGAVARLKSFGVGVIVIGPLTALYGLSRVALDRFDRIWHLPTVDVSNDEDGRSFLTQVLEARDANHMLRKEAIERLATLSGGVLRDLIALSQAAGEEAYVDGANQVEVCHVDTAAEIFGRKQLFAIDSQELAVLQRVRHKGTFVQTSEKDLALLATRRVLEYSNGQARFAVHPTIEPLLAQIPEVA